MLIPHEANPAPTEALPPLSNHIPSPPAAQAHHASSQRRRTFTFSRWIATSRFISSNLDCQHRCLDRLFHLILPIVT
jgi:hypothetical protein